jgi:mRNA-degrading endonuclease toxin of MazEF toxin-antitoxin module
LDRGEIWHINLDPVAGREQRGKRYVLIVSPKRFNVATGTPIILPITAGGDFARTKGFAVSLSGAGTNATGIVRCDQPRAVDMQARGGKRIEKVPEFIVEEVLAKLNTIFE